MEFIRIWTEVDTDEVQENILIVDDIFGFCPSCREMGIKLENLKSCPKCNKNFKYVTSREAKNGGKAVDMVKRIRKKLPDLIFVDYSDYEYCTSRKKAEGLFGGI
ncbi:MAG: hypothetical protein JW864_05955 [Spirochaetes bacterium]|nr:hypothetical protein [Spirochaetota bacterium]